MTLTASGPPVVLSTFSLQYEYADIDPQSNASGPHDAPCMNGGRPSERIWIIAKCNVSEYGIQQ